MPPFPFVVQEVWGWYSALCAERGSNGFGINPIKAAEIKAWADCKGINITNCEIELLQAIDQEYMGVFNG